MHIYKLGAHGYALTYTIQKSGVYQWKGGCHYSAFPFPLPETGNQPLGCLSLPGKQANEAIQARRFTEENKTEVPWLHCLKILFNSPLKNRVKVNAGAKTDWRVKVPSQAFSFPLRRSWVSWLIALCKVSSLLRF